MPDPRVPPVSTTLVDVARSHQRRLLRLLAQLLERQLRLSSPSSQEDCVQDAIQLKVSGAEGWRPRYPGLKLFPLSSRSFL